MNKIILIWLLAFVALSVNAQSKSSMIYGNALVKDKKMQRTGTVLTVIGGVALFAGNIMYYKIYDENDNTDLPEDKVKTSRYIMFGGLGLMAAGIPVWAIGVTKERHLKITAELVMFKGSTSVNGIGLKMIF